MGCRECAAFLSNYKELTGQYAVLTETLNKAAKVRRFDDPAFQKLKSQVAAARLDCQLARTALRIHKEGHLPPNPNGRR